MNTLEFHSIILLLQTNCSVYSYIISSKNKLIIVHLTEVIVSYIPKFNVLHMALVHSWNHNRDNFNVHSLLSSVGKRELDMSLNLAQHMEASNWFV